MDSEDWDFLDRAAKWTDVIEPVRQDEFARLVRILREFIAEQRARNSYDDERARGDDN